MTIKLLLLKSNEDIIADVSEMTVGEEGEKRVVGYFLNKPCIVKMRKPELLTEQSNGPNKKAGYEVSLIPWMPLTSEETIPVVADWIITMVEPMLKLKELYTNDIVNYGKNRNSGNSGNSGDASESDQTDNPDESTKVDLTD